MWTPELTMKNQSQVNKVTSKHWEGGSPAARASPTFLALFSIMQTLLQSFHPNGASLQPANLILSAPSLALPLWAELFQSCPAVCAPHIGTSDVLLHTKPIQVPALHQYIGVLGLEDCYPRTSASSELVMDLTKVKAACLLFSGGV